MSSLPSSPRMTSEPSYHKVNAGLKCRQWWQFLPKQGRFTDHAKAGRAIFNDVAKIISVSRGGKPKDRHSTYEHTLITHFRS